VNSVIGDDHGGIAVTPTNVFLDGDDSLGRWALDLTGAVNASLAGTTTDIRDAMVTNFHGSTVWSLATATDLAGRPGGDITRLVQLDAMGVPTTTVITLSQTIHLTNTTPSGGNVGLFSGWDEIAIYDAQTDPHVWLISLPSGTVTDLGAMATLDHQTCENWAYWGIVENFGGHHYLVARNSSDAPPTIDRHLVPTDEVTTISTFTDLSDMCTISLSPTLSRWYFHHEYNSQFTASNAQETIGYCNATITHP